MKSDSRAPAPLLWVPLLLVLLALGLKWMKLNSDGMSLLPNFSPWMALAFTGTLVFPRGTIPWWAWPLMLVGIDFAAMGGQFLAMGAGHPEVYLMYVLYGVAAWAANQMRGQAGILQTLLGATACSLVFYVVTNVLSWWTMHEYSKSLEGLVQALTTGLPGFPPTWVFLRNSLLSDLGFSALLLIAFNAEAKVRSAPTLRWATVAA
ncbi:hypothetical protein GCM10023213_30120 [Prosthecobacter algae]|uniref:Uncharacterized protein n=1 Tax=Prosthecobacter algae TaxID=1144682 RepID=A0ABP9PBG8_9BACT